MDNIKCDYITLWIKDAANNSQSDTENGLCVWNIGQNNYYYKDKALTTLMSVCDATLDERLDANITMMTVNAINGSTSQIDSTNGTKIQENLGCIGSFVSHSKPANTNIFEIRYNNASPIEVQTQAQPDQIRILFLKDDKSVVDLSNPDDGGEAGHITLKFKYFNQKDYEVSTTPF